MYIFIDVDQITRSIEETIVILKGKTQVYFLAKPQVIFKLKRRLFLSKTKGYF